MKPGVEYLEELQKVVDNVDANIGVNRTKQFAIKQISGIGRPLDACKPLKIPAPKKIDRVWPSFRSWTQAEKNKLVRFVQGQVWRIDLGKMSKPNANLEMQVKEAEGLDLIKKSLELSKEHWKAIAAAMFEAGFKRSGTACKQAWESETRLSFEDLACDEWSSDEETHLNESAKGNRLRNWFATSEELNKTHKKPFSISDEETESVSVAPDTEKLPAHVCMPPCIIYSNGQKTKCDVEVIDENETWLWPEQWSHGKRARYRSDWHTWYAEQCRPRKRKRTAFECLEHYNKVNPHRPRACPWNSAEDKNLRELVLNFGERDWHTIASQMRTKRSAEQCRKRWSNSMTVKRGYKTKRKFTEDQDISILLARKYYFKGKKGGNGNQYPENQVWMNVSRHVSELTPVQAQDRFSNHLDPGVNAEVWSNEERTRLIELVAKFGEYRTPWAKIARELGTNRTGQQVRIQWNLFKYRRTTSKRKKTRPKTTHDTVKPASIQRVKEKGLDETSYGEETASNYSEDVSISRAGLKSRFEVQSLERILPKGVFENSDSDSENSQVLDNMGDEVESAEDERSLTLPNPFSEGE